MGANKRILVVLATVVVAAECVIPFFKRESDPRPPNNRGTECDELFASCFAPVYQNPIVISGSSNFSILLSHVDELCNFYDEVVGCVRPSLYRCRERIRDYFEHSASAAAFLCSNRGRSLLREVQHSVCVSEPILLYGLGEPIESCIAESSQGEERNRFEVSCEEIIQRRTCAIRTAAQVCGEAAGEILSEIYNTVNPQFPGSPNCPEEGSQEYLKRGLEMFRKRFVK